MNKKGFTLIELLAVIIILAVIALIAIPVVLNVVEKATNESRKNSVRGYADSVKLSYVEEILENTGKPLKELANNKTQGSKVDCEYVKYDDKKAGTLLHSCKVDEKGNYCYINGYVYEDGTAECNNIINLIMSDGIPYNTPIIEQVSQTPSDTTYAQSKEISVEYPSLKVVEEKYFIKSSEILEINAIGKCGIEQLPSQCIEENVNAIEPNAWYQVSGNVAFTINKNMTIEAIIGNNNEYGTKETYEVTNIDTTKPEVIIESISTTSDKIVVNATCGDTESGIIKYEYTIDDTNYQESNLFSNLLSTNKYKVKVKCTNGSGISDETESEEIELKEIIKPEIIQISQTPEGEWAQKRVIRITYNGTGVENPKYYYSLDGTIWTEVSETTKDIEFTANGKVYAKTTDTTGNIASAATFSVDNVDSIKPAKPTIALKLGSASGSAYTSGSWTSGDVYHIVTSSDANSGISYYQYSHDGTSGWSNDINTLGWGSSYNSNKTQLIYRINWGGSWNFYIRAVDNAGNISDVSNVFTVKIDKENPGVNATVSGKTAAITLSDNNGLSGYTVTTSTSTPSSWTSVSGTSASKSWTASSAGTYYAWVKDVSGRTSYKAFTIESTAFCSYSAGKTWDYAYTGGVQSFTVPCAGTYKLEVWGAQGGTVNSYSGGLGGYSFGNISLSQNSVLYVVVGGKGGDTGAAGYNGGGTGENGNFVLAGGGGATHMATSTGVLSSLASNKSAVKIVAGGGSGGWYSSNYGKASSGYAGGGTTGSGTGGTQSAGGMLPGQTTSDAGFGYGANFVPTLGYGYGGGGGGYFGGAGGGIYYYGGEIINISGGGSGYIGGVTGGSMSNGQQSGNGKARITLVTISN